MFFKISYREIKRNINDHLIYFFTIAFSVAFIFSINNIIYSKLILNNSEEFGIFKSLLIFVNIFIVMVLCIVIAYSNKNLIYKRQQQFGNYLLFGFKKINLIEMIGLENLIFTLLAYMLGCVFGIGVYYFLVSIITKFLNGLYIFDFNIEFQAFTQTLIYILVISLISFLLSANFVRKSNITKLLNTKKNDQIKITKKPLLLAFVFLISLSAFACGLILIRIQFNNIAVISELNKIIIFAGAGLMICGAFFTIYFGCNSLVEAILKIKKIKFSKAIILLRNISANLKSNSMLISMMSMLITLSLGFMFFTFTLKAINDNNLSKVAEYDLYVNEKMNVTEYDTINSEELISRASEYAKIKNSYHSYIYSFENTQNINAMVNNDEKLLYMLSADVEKYFSLLKRDNVIVENDQFYIITANDEIENYFINKINNIYVFNNMSYKFIGIVKENIGFNNLLQDYVLVFANNHINGQASFDRCVINFETKVENGWDILPHIYKETSNLRSSVVVRQIVISRQLESVAFLMTSLFISIILIIITLMIMSIKLQDESQRELKNYALLNNLGIVKKQYNTIVLTKILFFAFMPLLIPLLCIYPMNNVINDLCLLITKEDYSNQLNNNVLLITCSFVFVFLVFSFLSYYNTIKSIKIKK